MPARATGHRQITTDRHQLHFHRSGNSNSRGPPPRHLRRQPARRLLRLRTATAGTGTRARLARRMRATFTVVLAPLHLRQRLQLPLVQRARRRGRAPWHPVAAPPRTLPRHRACLPGTTRTARQGNSPNRSQPHRRPQRHPLTRQTLYRQEASTRRRAVPQHLGSRRSNLDHRSSSQLQPVQTTTTAASRSGP